MLDRGPKSFKTSDRVEKKSLKKLGKLFRVCEHEKNKKNEAVHHVCKSLGSILKRCSWRFDEINLEKIILLQTFQLFRLQNLMICFYILLYKTCVLIVVLFDFQFLLTFYCGKIFPIVTWINSIEVETRNKKRALMNRSYVTQR